MSNYVASSNLTGKKLRKQMATKAKNNSEKNNLSLGQPVASKIDKNKLPANATKGSALDFRSPFSQKLKIPFDSNKVPNEENGKILNSALLRALKTLHDQHGPQNSLLLKKLFETTAKDESGSPLGRFLTESRGKPLQEPEDSDDEGEFVEYVFNPRRYFLYSVCEFCKRELNDRVVPCKGCQMTFYCCNEDMERDKDHGELCLALRKILFNRGEHIYNHVSKISPEDYRTYRVMTIQNCEQILGRPLQPFEKEVVIFPRNCCHCREWRTEYLNECKLCGQVYCKRASKEFQISHKQWCAFFVLLRKLIILQGKGDVVDPELPSIILKSLPDCHSTIKDILKTINADQHNECSYAAMTQIASAPLTVWYGLKLSQQLHKKLLTIHFIGAEMQFEADVMRKWELFILHISPAIQMLNIVFVGPELVPEGISMQPSIKNKVCDDCHKKKRTVTMYFEESMYHDYCNSASYRKPDLICFFNPGLHRLTGYNNLDSWPASIKTAGKQKCPVVVTSYTQYESPLDLQRFLKECDRSVNITLPPTRNPFSSLRPDRNFISDETRKNHSSPPLRPISPIWTRPNL